MHYTKLFVLAAVAAVALMAVASSASAAGGGLYSGTTPLGLGSSLDFSIPSGGAANLVDTSGNTLDKCTGSTVKGELTNAGSATVNPTGTISELTWTGCTFTTKTVSTGNKLEIEWTSGTNGSVKADSPIEVTINTVLFGSCIYGVAKGTSVGTLTTFGSGAATFDANAVATRFGTNVPCPATSKWTGSYTGTTPTNLRVEASGGGGEEEAGPIHITPRSLIFHTGIEWGITVKNKSSSSVQVEQPEFTISGMQISSGTSCFYLRTYAAGETCPATVKIKDLSAPVGSGYLNVLLTNGQIGGRLRIYTE